MFYTDGMTWQSRFAARVAAVLVLFGGLAHPAWATLLVSDLGGGQVRKFDDAGIPVPPIPFIAPGSGGAPAGLFSGGGEGLACLKVGAVPELFVANNGPTINIYDPTTGAFLRTFASGLGQVAALSLSSDGKLLYAADYGNGTIYAFNTADLTGAPIPVSSTPTTASHDVRVGPNGSVYATFFLNHTGVLEYSSNLASFKQFIVAGDPAPFFSSGMTFDNGGNLWLSGFGDASVYEYDPGGNFIRQVTGGGLDHPFGLDVGPDGNIYVANFSGNDVLKIDVTNCTLTNCSVSQFIADAGFEPKYLTFTENCCVVPEPGSMILVLAGMLGMVAATRRQPRRKSSTSADRSA